MYVPGYAATQPKIVSHYGQFQRLLSRASQALEQGQLGVAAVRAEIAAQYAMSRHTGLFASAPLEQLLLTIGQRIGQTLPAWPAPREQPRHIVHVLTRAFEIGGDTRLVARLIQHDADRCHSVVLTRQGGLPLPHMLRTAVESVGGELHVLNGIPGGLCAWAGALRNIAAQADLVILHVHPYDVIPLLALTPKHALPPVAYVNHADHAFAVGLSVSDVIADMRAAGALLSCRRRAVTAERSAILPIGLVPPRRTLSRAEARQQLGLSADTVLLLSVARPGKYRPFQGYTEAILPLLERYPQAVLFVVGPEHAGAWEEANRATGGRVLALGVQLDTALFYQAADIYIDSFPFVSNTSLLEAGSYGAALISRSLDPAAVSVLAAGAPGLDRYLVQTSDLDSFRLALDRLLADADYRNWLGAQVQQDICTIHSGDKWQHAIQTIYQQAMQLHSFTPWLPHNCQALIEMLDVLLVELFQGELDLQQIVQAHVRLLPPERRFFTWLGTRSRRPGLLLPEWLATHMERWWLRSTVAIPK